MCKCLRKKVSMRHFFSVIICDGQQPLRPFPFNILHPFSQRILSANRYTLYLKSPQEKPTITIYSLAVYYCLNINISALSC